MVRGARQSAALYPLHFGPEASQQRCYRRRSSVRFCLVCLTPQLQSRRAIAASSCRTAPRYSPSLIAHLLWYSRHTPRRHDTFLPFPPPSLLCPTYLDIHTHTPQAGFAAAEHHYIYQRSS